MEPAELERGAGRARRCTTRDRADIGPPIIATDATTLMRRAGCPTACNRRDAAVGDRTTYPLLVLARCQRISETALSPATT